MPACPLCGKELPTLATICQRCSNMPAGEWTTACPTKPNSHVMKVLHVVPMSTAAWALGWAIVGFFTATMGTLGTKDLERIYALSDVCPVMILVAVSGMLFAHKDRVDLRPIHTLLGSAIGPGLVLILCGRTAFGPVSEWGIGNIAGVLLCFVVTPASVAVGMIRGVRARGTESMVPLLSCASLMAACCSLAWWLSYTPVGRVFTEPRPAYYTRHYTPPQVDTANATRSASGRIARDRVRPKGD